MKKIFPSHTLKKATKLLVYAFHLFQRKKSKLSEEQKKTFESHLKALQSAILKKEKKNTKTEVKAVKSLLEKLFPKTPFQKGLSFLFALLIALCFALLIRQTLFELYEIPTGSMRPTLKEKDRLVVSKTTFGINTPFSLNQIYFNPNLVERNGIVVFSGEGMDIRDVDTRYFYIFPGKKQYVKRLIGKPGDTLYFYGGLIYGIDQDGNDISQELQLSRLSNIEHIPFIQFEGKALTPPQPTNGVYTPAILYQMNEPVAKLYVNGANQPIGTTLPILVNSNKVSPAPAYYDDLWGIKNFGMGRLLTRPQVAQYSSENLQDLPEGVLYLEIQHHPNLQNMKVKRDIRGRLRPMIGLNTSVIPLNEHHIETLFSHLYTARFIVKNGLAYRYGLPKSALQSPFLPKLPGVPDGTYEFYDGIAYKISWEGVSFELPKDHPIYTLDANRMQLFYNLGIEFDTRIVPPNNYPTSFPSRYVYYRNGALYAMGSPLFLPSDPMLDLFEQKEMAKQESSPRNFHYVPFVDHGAPINPDGSLNSDLVRQFGITIPNKMYLVLGDNHAMSADSREFGFVPEKNLKGSPDLIFWPPGPRFGLPNQPLYPFMNFPRAVMWAIVALSLGGYFIYQRERNKLPLL
jgi:signal peptidase I